MGLQLVQPSAITNRAVVTPLVTAIASALQNFTNKAKWESKTYTREEDFI